MTRKISHGAQPKEFVTALQPTSTGMAPAIPPTKTFCLLRRFSPKV